MMGRLDQNQERLFYSFCLDEVVPDDHLVRQIAAVLDLSWVHAELTPYYSRMGRPSIDSVLMIRMLLIGYVFAIRSERALCREVQVNLAYRWFCGLSIEDKIPDHSAFSRARNERFRDSDLLRHVFERVIEACLAAGLVDGDGFAIDASLIVADANKQRSIPGSEWSKTRDPATASRAVKEYLATLNDAAFGAATAATLCHTIRYSGPWSRPDFRFWFSGKHGTLQLTSLSQPKFREESRPVDPPLRASAVIPHDALTIATRGEQCGVLRLPRRVAA
jgi:transposase